MSHYLPEQTWNRFAQTNRGPAFAYRSTRLMQRAAKASIRGNASRAAMLWTLHQAYVARGLAFYHAWYGNTQVSSLLESDAGEKVDIARDIANAIMPNPGMVQ